MFGAIVYKEYIKQRVFRLVALGVDLVLLGYVFINLNRLLRLDHAKMVWYRVIHLGQIFYDSFTYVPVLTGLFLALAQFSRR